MMFDSTRHPDPRPLLVFAISAALTLALGTTATAQTRGELNPLTDTERQLAERVANEDARVRELAGKERVRLVYVELANVKFGKESDSDDAPPGRFAEVLHYRYDNDSGVLTLVEAKPPQVTMLEKYPGPQKRNSSRQSGQAKTTAGAAAKECMHQRRTTDCCRVNGHHGRHAITYTSGE